MKEAERLAKIGVQANIILGGTVIRPGTIMASGCEEVAGAVQRIVGGRIVKITAKRGGGLLGGFAGGNLDGRPTRWWWRAGVYTIPILASKECSLKSTRSFGTAQATSTLGS